MLAAQAQRLPDDEVKRSQFVADLRAKWAADNHVIREVVNEFATKLNIQLSYIDLGSPLPHLAAQARIIGRIGGQNITVDLHLDLSGTLHGGQSQRVGAQQARFVSKRTIAVMTAWRQEYEDFVLDLLEIE